MPRVSSATVGTANSEHMGKKPVSEAVFQDTSEGFLPEEPAVTGANAAMPLKLVRKKTQRS